MTRPPDDDPFAPPPEGTPEGMLPGYAGPAPRPEPRFAVPATVLGVLTPLLLLVVGVRLGRLAAVIVPVVLFGPVVAGVLLVSLGRGRRWRGFGLGLLIGWGVLAVAAAGLCIAILTEMG
jgi:hypothetical protein